MRRGGKGYSQEYRRAAGMPDALHAISPSERRSQLRSLADFFVFNRLIWAHACCTLDGQLSVMARIADHNFLGSHK
jgi:hypothetical protein